jgi:4-amino-4-deoxy-L-arabinose transferase-like glycosyltransferase
MKQAALFFISFVFLSLLIGFNVYSSFKNFGQLVYPLDDAYIHMAISKNLQQHGVWGVTRFEFSSTSSSPLYTILLSLSFALLGIKIWLPLVINWLVAAIVLWLVSKINFRFMKGKAAIIFNLLFIALVPLSGMAMLGMEHTLQILFCTLFLWLSYKKWNNESVSDLVYAAVAMLAVASRYESVFLIGLIAAAWLFVFKNWKQTILLAFAIALPICIFGIYAMSKGGYFVPNSLLAKSNYVNGGIVGFVAEVSKKILFNSLLAALVFLPAIYWIFFPIRSVSELKKSASHLIMLVVGITSIAHQVLASFGWMFRYEAYLIALLFIAIAITWNDWKIIFQQRSFVSRIIIFVFSAVLLFPILTRIQIPSFTNRAIKNINDQQLQMAKFVQQGFPLSGIAMNDIGATTFFNDDVKLFDLEGLGTLEILKIKKQFDSTFLKNYVAKHNIEIGIFYTHLYKGKIPASWEQVGTWEIQDRFVSAGSEVGFYAINPAVKEKLIEALQQYASSLPKSVVQKGIYINVEE